MVSMASDSMALAFSGNDKTLWQSHCVQSAETWVNSWDENAFRITGPMWGESMGQWWISPQNSTWYDTLAFCLLITWTSCWTNSRFPVIETQRCNNAQHAVNKEKFDSFVMQHSSWPCFWYKRCAFWFVEMAACIYCSWSLTKQLK